MAAPWLKMEIYDIREKSVVQANWTAHHADVKWSPRWRLVLVKHKGASALGAKGGACVSALWPRHTYLNTRIQRKMQAR